MGFGPTEDFLAYLKQKQAESKIIPPGELVRRVKAGPGPQSLGEAQQTSAAQASAQQGIETDTLSAVGRLENAWSGPSGDAAREALRPLADVAISASAALDNGQSILTDQAHAFTSTRNSLHEVSDTSPSKTTWDAITPWDTDNEDKINERNAAIQQNHAVYQGFTSASVGHAQKMPVDYGQIPDTAGTTGTTDTTQESSQVAGKQDHTQHTVARTSAPPRPVDRPSSPGQPETTTALPRQRGSEPHPGGQQSVPTPAASPAEDGTRTAGYIPSADVHSSPGSNPAGYNAPYVPSPAAGSGSHNSPGIYLPRGSSGGTGGGASQRGNPAAPGKTTGTGRSGGAAERLGRTGPGTAGARGANGMPLASGTGKGDKDEDKEHKTPDYLLEADPSALFGYDGKATPPVIGQ
ncbi:hypothetical protein OG943_43565 [Amycolatopsis sp. NBC_00345]|uniref:hypothetical protein n=1 Tax=Amycolatopsis sp. NBC_00345 TaxID=2975955 RepID=UPI002E2763AD